MKHLLFILPLRSVRKNNFTVLTVSLPRTISRLALYFSNCNIQHGEDIERTLQTLYKRIFKYAL